MVSKGLKPTNCCFYKISQLICRANTQFFYICYFTKPLIQNNIYFWQRWCIMSFQLQYYNYDQLSLIIYFFMKSFAAETFLSLFSIIFIIAFCLKRFCRCPVCTCAKIIRYFIDRLERSMLFSAVFSPKIF